MQRGNTGSLSIVLRTHAWVAHWADVASIEHGKWRTVGPTCHLHHPDRRRVRRRWRRRVAEKMTERLRITSIQASIELIKFAQVG